MANGKFCLFGLSALDFASGQFYGTALKLLHKKSDHGVCGFATCLKQVDKCSQAVS
jgi:hypothetical protein